MENYKIVTHKGGRGRFLTWSSLRYFSPNSVRGVHASGRETRLSVSHLQPHAWSFACLACVARRTKKKRETARSIRSVSRGFQLLGFDWNVFWCLWLVSFRLGSLGGRLRREVTHGATWRFLCRFWDNPTLAELWVKKTWHNTGHIHLSDFVKTWPLGLRLAPGAARLQASLESKKVGGLPSWSVQLNSPRTALTVGGWITP